MINYNKIEDNLNSYKSNFVKAELFPHIIIDDICYLDDITKLYKNIPPINTQNRSRDLFFSSKKYEKSNLTNIDNLFLQIHDDLLSDRFKQLLYDITNKKGVFIDNRFHGGGIHQGLNGSYLNMHTDFNYHPNHPKWLRYLNK